MKYSLIGVNGNVFSIMGYVKKAMRKEGKSQADIDGYLEEATSGDYSKLVSVSSDVIDKLNQETEEGE
jgi:hypothetical protein